MALSPIQLAIRLITPGHLYTDMLRNGPSVVHYALDFLTSPPITCLVSAVVFRGSRLIHGLFLRVGQCFLEGQTEEFAKDTDRGAILHRELLVRAPCQRVGGRVGG